MVDDRPINWITAVTCQRISLTVIPCVQLEHTQVHYHAFLQILNQGSTVFIPTDLGRSSTCYYWLHMHTNEAGIIHIESPSARPFTLGDFFDVWPYSAHRPHLPRSTPSPPLPPHATH